LAHSTNGFCCFELIHVDINSCVIQILVEEYSYVHYQTLQGLVNISVIQSEQSS
jgi:hypothetical protein